MKDVDSYPSTVKQVHDEWKTIEMCIRVNVCTFLFYSVPHW